MRNVKPIILGVVMAACAVISLAPAGVAAQVVPDSVDPYELAPQNVHLYPISLNARIPFYYLPPIFAPRPMWRGALTADVVHQIAPHNWVVDEVPDTTALVAWGKVKGDPKSPRAKTIVLEAANQQEFLLRPPENLRDRDKSYMWVRTEMRWVPHDHAFDIHDLLERELISEPQRVNSIAEELPVGVLLYNYERVDDVADLQPRIHPFLQDELATSYWPVERIYMNHSGWRRDPNRMRTMGDFISQWFTYEGKLLALKKGEEGDYLITVTVEGYQPWYPETFAQNMMRKIIALSFDEFVEPVRYYDVELPLGAKEWYRQGSARMTPYHTRQRAGSGGAGQGAY